MAITTPLPVNVLMGQPLPGLVGGLAPFNAAMGRFATLPRAEQYQLLDDAAAALRGAGTHPALVDLIERQIYYRHLGYTNAAAEALLLRAIQEALQGTAGAAEMPGHLHRLRLITQPLAGPPGGTSILIRGPAHLLHPEEARPFLVPEFGRVATELWQLETTAARALLDRWTLDHQSPVEVHAFASSPEKADELVARLADRGFDVRHAPIPTTLHHRGHAHWIVGSPGEQPVSQWLRRFVSPFPAPSVLHLDLADCQTGSVRTDIPLVDPAIEGLLFQLFHRPLTGDEVLGSFHMDVPGYRTSRLRLTRHGTSGVAIHWEIATNEGETAATLSGWIPDIPEPGQSWIAWGESLNGHSQGATLTRAQHMQKGVGRRAMQKVIGFLRGLGLNGLEMDARWEGIAFMPYVGFDFADEALLEETKRAFRAYLEEREIHLSPIKSRELAEIRHAWEIVDFQSEDEAALGREFLDFQGRDPERSVRLHFGFSTSHQGWRRLFGRQLDPPKEDIAARLERAHRTEEWRRRTASRLGALTSLSVYLDPQLPEPIRAAYAELAGLALDLRDDAHQARRDARLDGKTGLLTHQALMSHSRELEKGMEAHRSTDRAEPHGVLFIDIDHFKAVNSQYGHVAADEVLKVVAMIIHEATREGDIVARFGGEEFCAILRHAGPGARRAAERILRRVSAQPIPTSAGPISVTVSIGIAPFRLLPPPAPVADGTNPFEEPRETQTSLLASIADANRRMLRAKEAGRNRIVDSDDPA